MSHPAASFEPQVPALRLLEPPGEPTAGEELRALVRGMRPTQWAKNVLLAAPLVASHHLDEPERVLPLLPAILAFCACASAVYLFNDWLDVESDRAHPIKRQRPLASGALRVQTAIVAIVVLLAGSFGLSVACLPWSFSGVLALYLVSTTWYTLQLKRELLVDVLVLAGLYTLRMLAGGLATDTPISEWLLAFSMFVFLSLALVKRYAELLSLAERNETEVLRRGYVVGDLSVVQAFGTACAALAVLVYCLYIATHRARAMYASPELLWLLGPVLMYWLARFWFLARRGEMADDPVIFTLRDRASYVVALIAGGIMVAATYCVQ